MLDEPLSTTSESFRCISECFTELQSLLGGMQFRLKKMEATSECMVSILDKLIDDLNEYFAWKEANYPKSATEAYSLEMARLEEQQDKRQRELRDKRERSRAHWREMDESQ